MFEPDLADRVDDLICIFEGGNPDQEMDTISMLLTGWIIFLFSSIALIKFIYIKYLKKEKTIEQIEQELLGNVPANGVSKSDHRKQEHLVAKPSNTQSLTSAASALFSKATTTTNRQNTGVLSVIRKDGESQNICTGPDPAVVDYINNINSWLYSTTALRENTSNWEYVKDGLVDTLGRILREQGKKELPIFVSIVDINLTNPIQLTNLYAECEHANNIKITCDCEATKLHGVLSLYSTDIGSSSCEFFIDRVSGRLNILLDCEEQIAVVKFDGWPEICVGIKSSSSADTKLESKTSEFLAEKLASAIRSSVLEIEFKKFSTFPTPQTCLSPITTGKTRKKYLVAKIVRGTDLGLSKGCEEPYCAVELDDPPQKFQTERQNVSPSAPLWNENFVFNVLPSGGEILFEVYDYIGTRFLGCNILSVDEITNDKARRTLTLPLKSRRMEMTEQITGALEVQLAFMNENELAQKSKVESLKGVKVDNALWNGKLRDTETSPNKGVLVVESKESPNPNPNITRLSVKIIRASDGSILEVNETNSETEQKTNHTDSEQAALDGTYGEERGRRKTRRGDIFTSIRRRFSKGRSTSLLPAHSAGSNATGEGSDLFGRSISADRQSLALSVNNTAGLLNSTRSSASELSGLSGHSTTTFIHENSTLVIECIENRVKKYYLVPPHLAETGKWKKRGKKLHIYNDHTFVAKRLPSGTPCAVCFGRFQFSLGKQGYQCRDCKVKCHKECHVRAPSFCANTTVYDIELAAVKPIPTTAATTTTTKSSSSPFHTLTEKYSAFFTSKKSAPPADANSADNLNKKVSTAAITTKKGKTLPIISTNPSSPPNGAPTKIKSTRKMNIFRRVSKLGKISEEANPVPTSFNSTTPPKSPKTAGGELQQESTVTILIQNEEEDLQEQETTALIQVKCNTIINTKNIKDYSIE